MDGFTQVWLPIDDSVIESDPFYGRRLFSLGNGD